MSNGRKPALRSKTAVITGLVAVLVIAVAGAILWYNKQLVCCRTNDNSNAAPPIKTELVVDAWPKYASSLFAFIVSYPPGMSVCDYYDSEGILAGISVRNDTCDSATNPSYTFRISGAWSSLDAVASFNDAYGQQLKEAGVTSVSDRGVVLNGKTVSALLYNVSTTMTGAIVYSMQSNTNTVVKKKIAVDIYRDVPPTARAIVASADQITEAVLKNIALSLPVAQKQQPVSPWKTATVEQGGFSIDYPSSSTAYEATPQATLSVMLIGGARLEVRYGNDVESTKGGVSLYKKLTKKLIKVNGASVNEERYVPIANETSAQRLLFVSFSKGTRFVGITFSFSGDPVEEKTFETVLNSFKFL
ncbi:MAG: hypothetical protein V1907_03235 [Candidatus Kerfeldbacteria bacterium]